MAALDVLCDLNVIEQSLVPVRPSQVNRSRGGGVQGQESAFMWWRSSFSTTALTQAEDALFQSVMARIGVSSDGFLCHDLFRPRPVLAVAPLTQPTATLTAIAARTVSISGGQVGLVLSPGDYIELRDAAGGRVLNTVSDSVTIDAGGVADVALDFPLNTARFVVGDVVNFERASCVMKRVQPAGRNYQTTSVTCSFEAEEVA
ncbi:MAG: hypothetical protein AAF764_03985 [Pseudomonadota bacterium]